MKKLGKKLHRIFSFAIAVVLVVETVNCATLTVSASVEQTEAAENQAELELIDTELEAELDGLQKEVDAADDADKAAYEARLAAEKAAEAVQNLANTVLDAEVVEKDENNGGVVLDEDGAPELEEELEETISDAEVKVEEANESYIEAADEITVADVAAKEAEKVTEYQQFVAGETTKAAQFAADSAQKALDAINNAETDGRTQDEMKDELHTVALAVEAAQKAEDVAYNALNEATKAYNNAVEKYNEAVKATENIDDEAAAKALEEAQKAVQEAAAVFATAEQNYNDTMTEVQRTYETIISSESIQSALDEESELKKPAEEAYAAAQNAAAEAEAAKDVVLKKAEREAAATKLAELEVAEKNAQDNLATAEAEKAVADQALADLEAQKAKAEEDKTAEEGKIAVADNAIEAADKVIANANKKLEITTNKVKDDGLCGLWCKDKTHKHTWIGAAYYYEVYYTQDEVNQIHSEAIAEKLKAEADKIVAQDEKDAAQNRVDTLNGCITDYNNKITIATEAQTVAQNNLNEKKNAKDAAASATNAQSAVKATLDTEYAALQKFVYNDDETEITYLDKEKKEAVKAMLDKLAAEQEVSGEAYEEAKNDTAEYIEATVDEGFWKEFIGIFTGDTWKDLNDELMCESKYHNEKVFSKDGTCFVFKTDENNTGYLIALTENRASITAVDAREYAAYSTSFDAIAAAQAAQNAADAAKAEAEALQDYYAAKEALVEAQKRVEALELLAKENAAKKAELEAAKRACEQAEVNKNAAEEAYKATKEISDNLEEQYKAAQEKVSALTLQAGFYLLNAGFGIPAEPETYPSSNYTLKQTGEVISDAANITSSKETWIVDPASVKSYIVNAPTAKDFGLDENLTIHWYVVKRETDNTLHVDGIIEGQLFNLKIHYGYKDANDNFVEWTERAVNEDIVLNAEYEYASPEIEFYSATKSIVSGTMKGNVEVWVEYTQKPVTPVEIRYFRGVVDDTPEYVDNSVRVETEDVDTVEELDAYVDVIEANKSDNSTLNQYRTEGYYDGTVVAYGMNDAGLLVIDILYTSVPVDVDEDDDDDDDEEIPAPINEPVIITPVNPTPVAPVAPIEPITIEDLETTIIEEEITPLAPVVEEEKNREEEVKDVVVIEEEETPLAGPGNCWIHWLILILTAMYTVYSLLRCINRNNKINKLQESAENAEA